MSEPAGPVYQHQAEQQAVPMVAMPMTAAAPAAAAPPLPQATAPPGPVHPGATLAAHPGGSTGLPRGQEKIHWSKEIWDHLDMAVHDECKRIRVAAKFLPIHKVPEHTTTVPADSVIIPVAGPAGVISAFSVDEGAVTRLIEFWVEFSLTPQQVEQEMQIEHAHRGHSTAVTLAIRAANLLTQAEDMIIFQGAAAFGTPFFAANIRPRGVPADFGLLDILPAPAPAGSTPLPAGQVIRVPQAARVAAQYGENTFGAVAQGYAVLQGNGHYGPYALVLHTIPYADTHAPLRTTLIMPADRIMPLMTAGFFGSGTLVPTAGVPAPAGLSFTGSLVSVGGNTMDLVVGFDAKVAFMQQDVDGSYRFRVVERLALRLKDLSAVIRLEFA